MVDSTGKRCSLCIFLSIILIILSFPSFNVFAADNRIWTVRVGYYENEVFQEGASSDAVKTGYAYEYYRKLSEYTGWNYEYVYGSFGELYDKLLSGEIDLLAGLAKRDESRYFLVDTGHWGKRWMKHLIRQMLNDTP